MPQKRRRAFRLMLIALAALLGVCLFFVLYAPTVFFVSRDVATLGSYWRLSTQGKTTSFHLQVGGRIEGAPLGQEYAIEHALPYESGPASNRLCFWGDHQRVHVYLGDQMLYAYETDAVGRTVIHDVRLPASPSGSLLRIELYSEDPHHYDVISPIYLGGYGRLNGMFVTRFVIRFIPALLLLVLTVGTFVSLLLSLKGKMRRFLPLYLFLLTGILLPLSGTALFSKLAGAQAASLLQHLCLYLLPLAVQLQLLYALPGPLRRLMLFPAGLNGLFVLAALTLHFLGLVPISAGAGLFFGVALLCTGCSLCIAVFAYRDSPSLLWAVLTFFALFICFIVDCIGYFALHAIEDFYLFKCTLPVLCTAGVWTIGRTAFDFYYRERFHGEISGYLLDTVLQNYASLEQQLLSMRRISHDLKNHYACLYHLQESGRPEEMLRYLKNLSDDYARALPDCASGNIVIDSVLNDKLSRIRALGAQVRQTIRLPEELPFAARDLCSILSNILDNACEALLPQGDAGTLDFSLFTEDDLLFILCQNSKTGPTLEVKGRLATTKPSPLMHGFGLGIVQSLVDKYKGTLHIDYDDAQFSVSISLPLV